MKIGRILILSAAVALVAGSPSLGQSQPLPSGQSAPSAETLQTARELASLTSAAMLAQTITNMSNQVWPTVETSLRAKDPRIDAETLALLRRDFEQLQYNALVETMQQAAWIYAHYFTTDELRQIIVFYHSPVGAKTLTVMPQATAALFNAMAPRLQTLAATVQQRFAVVLQQRGYRQ